MKVIYSLAVAAVLLTPSMLSASILDTLTGGVVNELEDNDWETGVLASPPDVNAGDTLFGGFSIQGLRVPPFAAGITNYPDGNGNTFAGIFLNKVLTESGGGGAAASYTLGAGTAADWEAAFPTLFNATNTGLYDSLYGDPAAGTMIIVFEHSPLVPGTNPTPSAVNMLWELGFTGAGGSATGGEFWTADTTTDLIIAGLHGSVELAVNTTKLGNAPATFLQPHNFLGAFDPSYTGLTDLQGKGTFDFTGTTVPGYPITSDTDFYILPVPEPHSAVVWGVLGVALVVVPTKGASMRKAQN